jgi:hypothetical protein
MPAIARAQPAAPPSTLSPADTVREGRFRLEEMKVEMAWLADSATFPYPLTARSVEGHLELRGSAPNETTRQLALRIARAHTHLAVANLLQLDAKLAASESGIDAAAIRQGTVEVLSDSFGMAARGFEIRADADGKVAVSGSVNSVEEKLAVSKRLRKVRGCRYASNYLQISPEMRDGRMVTRINAAGTLIVPGQVLCLDGTGQESSTPNFAPVMPLTAAPAHPITVAPAASARPVTVAPAASARPVTVAPAAAPAVVAAPAPPPATASAPWTTPVPPPVMAPAPRTTPVTQASPQPPAIRPVGGHVPATSQPAPRPAGIADSAMPIEVPVPTIVTPVPPPMRPLASDRVPPPSMVPGQFDMMMPGPVQAQTRPTTPRPTTTVSAPPPRDLVKPVSNTGMDKPVDLLAAPTVPEAWNKDNSPAQPKAKAPSNFAVTRTPPPSTTKDELLRLPDVPATAQKQSAKAADAAKPATESHTADNRPFVGPVVSAANKETKAASSAVTAIPVKPPSSTTVQSQPPALKPLPTPAPTAFKDTWVDAMPAPKPAPKATPPAERPQPPPGGWPTAHRSRPTPTAYVTSGVVVFQDEPVSAAPPTRPVKPVVESKADAKPATQLVSRIEPVAPPAPVHPTTTMVVERAPVSGNALAPAAAAAKIKQQVERACGRLATHVDVHTTDKGVTVHVKCADAAAAQKITDKVLIEVPEMADTKVKFEVEVAR